MSKSKILVVDDDPKLSGFLAVVLDRVGGYQVREENRPFAAVQTVREFLPQLILLDVDMPGKDGGAIFTELSKDPKTAHIPVVFVTSLVSKSESGLRNGKHYLSKPVEPNRLLEIVRSFCPASPPTVAV